MTVRGGWQGLGRELEGLLDILFPPRCLLCSAALPSARRGGFCRACRRTFSLLHPPFCPICALPHATLGGSCHPCSDCLQSPPAYERTVAAGLHEEGLRQAIHRFKFAGAVAFDRPLAMLLARRWRQYGENWPVEVLVPVPLHPRKLRARTYNQALLLARQLGERWQMPVLANTLQRIRETAPQPGLDIAERQRNLIGAFAMSRPLQGERVLLVDDVMTTGATARACAEVLRQHGASAVAVAVLARARRHGPQVARLNEEP